MRAISDDQFTDWARGLRSSERAVFAELFQAMYDGLFGYARYIVHEPEAAHDVLQDVFMKLWRMRADIDPNRSLKALLYQMVRNYALNHERQRKTRLAESIDDGAMVPVASGNVADEVDAGALDECIRGWIAQLPDRRREAFVLSRYEGLSHDEIARVMKLAPRTVNNHIVLALQDLRAQLKAYEADNVA